MPRTLKFETFQDVEQTRKALEAAHREIMKIIEQEREMGLVADTFRDSREVLRDLMSRIGSEWVKIAPANMKPFEWPDLDEPQAFMLHYALGVRSEQLQMHSEQYHPIIGNRLAPSIEACDRLTEELFRQFNQESAR